MNLIERVKNIITSPKTEWDVIAGETPDINKIITGYVLPLAGIAAIAAFIGYGVIGFSMFGVRVSGISWGIYHLITVLVSAVVGVFVSAFVIDALAPSFASEKNMGRSVQLVAYAYTPAWIGGILAILPVLSVLGAIFSIYGLYLLYLGIPKLKGTPEDKHPIYFIVSLVVAVVVFMIIGTIMTFVLMPVFGLSYGSSVVNIG